MQINNQNWKMHMQKRFWNYKEKKLLYVDFLQQKVTRWMWLCATHTFHSLYLIPYCILPLLESTVCSYPCPKEKCKYGRTCIYIFLMYTCMYHIHTHASIYEIYITYTLYTMSLSHIPWEVKKIPQFTLPETYLQARLFQLHLVALERCCLLVIFFHILATVTANPSLKGYLLSSAVFLYLKTT